MGDVYIYADETGNLDMSGKHRDEVYFGFGTVTWPGEHAGHAWQAQRLRHDLELGGTRIRDKFHAVDDRNTTEDRVYELIDAQHPRIDTTLLHKASAQPHIVSAGEMRLYKMAWWLHLKKVLPWVSCRGDTVFVTVATLGTKARQRAAEEALADVCQQVSSGRTVRLCSWDSASCWGLQVADYCLWAVQRDVLGRSCRWFADRVAPHEASRFLPWGQA